MLGENPTVVKLATDNVNLSLCDSRDFSACLVFHSDFACYFTSINFLFCFTFGFDFGIKCFCNFFHFFSLRF